MDVVIRLTFRALLPWPGRRGEVMGIELVIIAIIVIALAWWLVVRRSRASGQSDAGRGAAPYGVGGSADVWIEYMDADGAVTERRIIVHDVVRKRSGTEIQAYCQMRGEMRTFRADRVLDMKLRDGQRVNPQIFFREVIKDIARQER